MVMLYEGGLKKLTVTRYPVYPIMSYSVSRTGYVVGYVVNLSISLVFLILPLTLSNVDMIIYVTIKSFYFINQSEKKLKEMEGTNWQVQMSWLNERLELTWKSNLAERVTDGRGK
jgi:hypothetical protein